MFFIFELLIVFFHSSHWFGEYLYDHYFRFLSGKLLISISLRFFPVVLSCSFSGTYFSVTSFCFTLHVCFYLLGETAVSPNLEGKTYIEMNLIIELYYLALP